METSGNAEPGATEALRLLQILRLAESRVAAVTFFFLLGLLVRIYFAVCHPYFDNIFAVRGEPYSDGLTWTAAGVRLAQGEGLDSVYRPGFSVLLSLFYVWFGYSANFITAVQLVIGALTGAFIYLVGERTLNRWVGAAAACFFIFDPSQLTQTPQATTEPLGLLFFVASIYTLLLFGPRRRLSIVLLSGILLALSNLTRPLTLFCVPFYALQLLVDEWRQSRKLLRAFLPAIVFCCGIVLTMSPWLIRQKAVHGVWAVSTNLGEALYGATSPKYGTWTSLVRADANRAGVAPDVASRYRFFVAQSLENIRRYPAFYAREVAQSYWQFLNSFHLKIRSQTRTFSFPQWTGLVEGQKLFLLLLGAFLLAPAAWWWSRSELLRSSVFLSTSGFSLLLWWLIPNSGFLILFVGFAVALWRYRSENIALLGWSVVGAGIGDAVFNNAILYRAVLMTDWIYSLIYFFTFYVVTEALTGLVLKLRTRPMSSSSVSLATEALEANLHAFERRTRLIWQVTAILFGLFVLAGSVRLGLRNFRPTHQVVPTLSVTDQKQLINRLRQISPIMRKALPDSRTTAINFVEPEPGQIEDALKKKGAPAPAEPTPGTVDFSSRNEVVVRYEELLPIIYYFPRGTDFGVRDRIFRERPYDASVLRTARAMTVFPGQIPPSALVKPAVLVGWMEGPHPGGSWLGQVMQCVAIVPVSKKGQLDYRHAVIAAPRANGIR